MFITHTLQRKIFQEDEKMFNQNLVRKCVSVGLAVAVWSVSSMVALAAVSAKNSGELMATGQVTVNGQVVSGSTTIVSGSTINTGENSTAVVNLGKLGRIDISSTASLTVNFTENTVNVSLDSGRVAVDTVQGVTARVTTKDGLANSDLSQSNSFAVTVECSFTNVESKTGSVALAGGSDMKQVAAGTEASLGVQQAGCKPCLRPVPGGASVATLGGLGGAGLLALLLAGGAAAGTAVIVGTSGGNSDVNTGNTTIVSAVR